MNSRSDEPAGLAAGMPPAASDPLLVTVKEAGNLLRCGKSKVFAMIKAGLLERRKLGGATRVTMASIRQMAGL